jgi:hypothetical protein
MKTKETERTTLSEDLQKHVLIYVELSLQHEDEVKEIIKYNKENNYCYKIIARNLIDTECLLCFVRNGYKISPWINDVFKNDCMLIYHEQQ